MIWLNGEMLAAENAISADDRGLLLGESLFETVLLLHGIPQFWDAHIARLRAGAAALGLPLTYDDAVLKQAVRDLVAGHEMAARAVLRLTLTGGNGGRGLVPRETTAGNLIMQISPAAAPPAQMRLAKSDIVRLAGQPSHVHKTGAYLDNILARRQALEVGGDEAVMCNQFGRVACAAAGNIFAAFGKHLITPPVSEGALPGTVRGALLRCGSIGAWQIGEGLIEMERLADADAIFVTNSLNGVVTAIMIGGASATKNKQSAVLGDTLNDALPKFTEF